ncbi:helix-turn-helix domain-containing protein [Lewinella sp. W8]|uniref:helix-turn-helix domain-containing protein n=1 Tax=Lewinella sp. W8 TaxID=2528208 RepID=UPI001067F4EA|nr:helix-turn-helix domain-containing protein [Lewinella sp. W8]
MAPSTIILLVVLSLGAIQGIVYAALIFWRRKAGDQAPLFLVALLLMLSYRLGVEILQLFGLGRYDFWYHVLNDCNWIYGPLLFLFVSGWMKPDFRLSWRHWPVLLPVAVEFVISNFVRTQNFYWDGTRESLSWAGFWGYVIWMNYPTKYLIASGLIIYYCLRSEKLLTARRAEPEVAWIWRVVRIFRWYFTVVLVVMLGDFLVDFDSSFETFYYFFTKYYYYPFLVGIAVLTYWLGIEALGRIAARPGRERVPGAADDTVLALAGRLDQLMREEEPFRDPELTLAALAERLEVKPYLVSKCLNEVVGNRFNDYINQWRLRAWKQALTPDNLERYTMVSLAYSAGFNSKASFHRAVQKFTGTTPGKVKQQLLENLRD